MYNHRLTYLFFLLPSCLLLARGQDQLTETERLSKARQLFIQGTALQLQGGHHAEAVLEFQESLQYNESAITLTAMARSFLELGKVDRAETNIRRALEIESNNRDAWEVLSEILVASGRYDEGLSAYEHVVEHHPTRRQLYTLARMYEPRNAKRAAELYERCAALAPDVDVYMRLAGLYKRLQDNAQCVLVLEKAYALDRSNRRIRISLVDAYLQVQRIPDAITIARTDNIGRFGGDEAAEIWGYLLGRIAEDSALVADFPSEIRPILNETLSKFHRDYVPLVSAGELALRLHDDDLATQLMSIAAQQVPDRFGSSPFLHICVVFLTNSRPATALSFAKEYQRRFVTDPRFLVVMGDASVALQHTKDAIDYYRTALDIDPQQVEVWIQLGLQTDNAGLIAESDHAYKQAIQLDPDNSVACNNLAYSLANRDLSLDVARDLSWRAVQQQPTNPAYLDTYAWILFRLGDVERARTYMDQAVKYGGNATHYEHLGDILEQLGEYEAARNAWNRSIELDPERAYLKTKIDQQR